MATDWVEMVHDVTGGKGLVPNKASVIAARRKKGWRLASEPAPVVDAPVADVPNAPTDANDDKSSTKSTRKARSRAAVEGK